MSTTPRQGGRYSDSPFQVNPNVTYEVLQESVVFYNHFDKARFESDPRGQTVFEFFRIPALVHGS